MITVQVPNVEHVIGCIIGKRRATLFRVKTISGAKDIYQASNSNNTFIIKGNSMQRSTALSLIDAIIEGVLNDRIKIHRILDEQVHPKMNKNTNITPKISIDEKVSNQDDGWNQLSDTHISGSIPGSMSFMNQYFPEETHWDDQSGGIMDLSSTSIGTFDPSVESRDAFTSIANGNYGEFTTLDMSEDVELDINEDLVSLLLPPWLDTPFDPTIPPVPTEPIPVVPRPLPAAGVVKDNLMTAAKSCNSHARNYFNGILASSQNLAAFTDTVHSAEVKDTAVIFQILFRIGELFHDIGRNAGRWKGIISVTLIVPFLELQKALKSFLHSEKTLENNSEDHKARSCDMRLLMQVNLKHDQSYHNDKLQKRNYFLDDVPEKLHLPLEAFFLKFQEAQLILISDLWKENAEESQKNIKAIKDYLGDFFAQHDDHYDDQDSYPQGLPMEKNLNLIYKTISAMSPGKTFYQRKYKIDADIQLTSNCVE